MTTPHIAILILNYNGQHWLDACLTSLMQLTTPAELVVVDNASTDGSLEYLRQSWPQVRVLTFEKNLGFAGGYNRAFQEVECEWGVMLNNDAALTPGWLEALLQAVAVHPQAAVLGGKLLFQGPEVTGRIVQSAGACFTDAGTAFEIGWGQPDRGQYDQPTITGSIPGAALMIRRAIYLELGGFDAHYFTYLEDVDLCWRAWLAGYEVRYIPQAEAFHYFGGYWGGRTSPRRIRLMQRNRLANMLKHLQWRSLPSGLLTSILYDGYRVLEFLLTDQWAALRALAQGTLDFWRDWPNLWRHRQHIQATRRVSDQELRQRQVMVSAFTALREYRRLAKLS